MLDVNGHLRLTDFGLAKVGLKRDDRTNSFCGTPEYLAPEIIMNQGHSFEADWWALGALLYEMLQGNPPHFSSKDKGKMMRNIAQVDVPIPSRLSPEARSLLQGMLNRD